MAQTKNTYTRPVKEGEAISDARAHFNHVKHAIDFLVSEGTKIYAAKGGTVFEIKQSSNEGGKSKKYAKDPMKYLNFITIKHCKGEFSQYAHIKHKGALVKVNDKVRQGQPIALSGNTGFSTAPHLHFHVVKLNNTDIGWETLKVKFKEKVKVKRIKAK